MEFQDARSYLAAVEAAGELIRINGADPKEDVGPITEITAWTPEHPMVVFEDFEQGVSGCRIAVHAFDSYRRMQLLYGFDDGMGGADLVRWWKNRLSEYAGVPPVAVDGGPVMENVLEGDDVDLTLLPAPVWHVGDVGPYLVTGGASVLKDPDNGRLNVGCYRGLLYDKNTIGHHLAAGHHGQVIRDKWFARGENCPIVISIGHDPSLTLAAAEYMAFGDNEFEFGGFLRGAPYEVIAGPLTGLPLLAAAEVVLEGEILNPEVEPRRPEGPWGEAAGYYNAGFPQPPVRINALYHRSNPIILGEPTLRFRNRGAAGGFGRLARKWHLLERSGLEGIVGVGNVGPFLVVAVRQFYSGQVLRIADYVMSGLGDRPPRYLVMVDDDIDPSSRRMVEWAISTRADPSQQVHIQRDRWASATNPAGLTLQKRAIEDYSVGTVIIDACRPFRWRDDWPYIFAESDIPEDGRLATATKWEARLGELITRPKPV